MNNREPFGIYKTELGFGTTRETERILTDPFVHKINNVPNEVLNHLENSPGAIEKYAEERIQIKQAMGTLNNKVRKEMGDIESRVIGTLEK